MIRHAMIAEDPETKFNIKYLSLRNYILERQHIIHARSFGAVCNKLKQSEDSISLLMKIIQHKNETINMQQMVIEQFSGTIEALKATNSKDSFIQKDHNKQNEIIVEQNDIFNSNPMEEKFDYQLLKLEIERNNQIINQLENPFYWMDNYPKNNVFTAPYEMQPNGENHDFSFFTQENSKSFPVSQFNNEPIKPQTLKDGCDIPVDEQETSCVIHTSYSDLKKI